MCWAQLEVFMWVPTSGLLLRHFANTPFSQEHAGEKVIVYFLTCAAVDFYALALPLVAPKQAGVRVSALHGRMKQAQRQATLAAFAKAPSGLGAVLLRSIPAQAVRQDHLQQWISVLTLQTGRMLDHWLQSNMPLPSSLCCWCHG